MTNVVQPDLTIVCNPARVTPRGCYGPPDWVIEILSPHTAIRDLNQKRELYERMGIAEYWLFDPGNRCLYVHRLDDAGRYGEASIHLDGATVRSEAVAGPVFALTELFDAARIA